MAKKAFSYTAATMSNTVMIIDDSEEDQYISKRILSKTNLVDHIYQSFDGQEAIDFIKVCTENTEQKIPNLIFLDINMPKMNGHEFLEEFKDLKSCILRLKF